MHACRKDTHLAYDAWRNRGLDYITNNQANCVIIDADGAEMPVFVTNESFARKYNPDTYRSEEFKGWYLRGIKNRSDHGSSFQMLR